MNRTPLLLALLLVPAARADEAAKSRYSPYSPSNHAFTCEILSDWSTLEEETPRGTAIHILGPSEANGNFRTAINVHYFEREKPGFVPWQESLGKIRERDPKTSRESTMMSSWRIAKKPAKLFEIKEDRLLPMDRLPAERVTLHHFYALVPGGGEDYFLIKLSSTEKTYLEYRDEFKRFLRSFKVAAND